MYGRFAYLATLMVESGLDINGRYRSLFDARSRKSHDVSSKKITLKSRLLATRFACARSTPWLHYDTYFSVGLHDAGGSKCRKFSPLASLVTCVLGSRLPLYVAINRFALACHCSPHVLPACSLDSREFILSHPAFTHFVHTLQCITEFVRN